MSSGWTRAVTRALSLEFLQTAWSNIPFSPVKVCLEIRPATSPFLKISAVDRINISPEWRAETRWVILQKQIRLKLDGHLRFSSYFISTLKSLWSHPSFYTAFKEKCAMGSSMLELFWVRFNAADSKGIFVWWPAAQKWLQDHHHPQVKYDQKKLLCMIGIVVFL